MSFTIWFVGHPTQGSSQPLAESLLDQMDDLEPHTLRTFTTRKQALQELNRMFWYSPEKPHVVVAVDEVFKSAEQLERFMIQLRKLDQIRLRAVVTSKQSGPYMVDKLCLADPEVKYVEVTAESLPQYLRAAILALNRYYGKT